MSRTNGLSILPQPEKIYPNYKWKQNKQNFSEWIRISNPSAFGLAGDRDLNLTFIYDADFIVQNSQNEQSHCKNVFYRIRMSVREAWQFC